MIKKFFLHFIYISLCLPATIFSQSDNSPSDRLKELESQIANAGTLSQKLNITAHLGSFYLNNGDRQKAETIWKGIIETAAKSGDKRVLSQAYKDVGYEYILSQNDQSLFYLQQSVAIAKEATLKNEELFALQCLSYYYLTKANHSKALEIYNQIEPDNKEITDSARCEYYAGKSELHFARGEMLENFKALFNAKKYADKSGSKINIRYVNRLLASSYIKIKDYEKALFILTNTKNEYEKEKIIHRVHILNTEIADVEQLRGNTNLSEDLYKGVIGYADSTSDMQLKMRAVFGLYNLYSGANKKISAFDEQYKVSDYFKSIGNTPSYYAVKASTFFTKNNPDSAEYYLQKALAAYDSTNNPALKIQMLIGSGNFYRQQNKMEKSLSVLIQSLQLNDSLKVLTNYPAIYTELDSTYAEAGDFTNAYKSTKLYQYYTDSLEKLGRTEDILREEIASEEESMKLAEEKELKAIERKHNIQYRIIIIGGILLLTILLALGFFNPPLWVIRVLAFVSFIFIFEFIIFLLDTKLHHWAHGAPLPILLIKVLIACLLVPLHHFTEHKVIHFLHSKKLHRLKTAFKNEKPAKT